jgi:hypothetical protein
MELVKYTFTLTLENGENWLFYIFFGLLLSEADRFIDLCVYSRLSEE